MGILSGLFKKKAYYNRCYFCGKGLGGNSLIIYLTCDYCGVKVCADHYDKIKKKGVCPYCGNPWK